MVDMSKIEVRRVNSIGIAYGDPIPHDLVPWEVGEEIAEAAGAGSGECEVGGQRYSWRKGDGPDPAEVGRRIGRAMARDARAEGMPTKWTGLDAQDGDVATAAGIEPGTEAWAAMEAAAREEFRRTPEGRTA